MRLCDLTDYTDQILEAARFRDYCPNGLQVEGRAEVARLVTGVSASLELLRAAVRAKADAVLVHHGWLWRNEDVRILGMKRERIACALASDLSLVAYHLPLDAHRELGNNVQLGRRLGLEPEGWFGEQEIAAFGRTGTPTTLGAFAAMVCERLAREPLVIGDVARPLHRVAWCTGAAQGYLEAAVALRVDAFLTGEVSEQTVHIARETGVAFLAAGHHATERYGVQALGEHLAQKFGLEHSFIDIPNPV